MVDSVDRERIGISKSELVAMLEVSEFFSVSQLFLCFETILEFLRWCERQLNLYLIMEILECICSMLEESLLVNCNFNLYLFSRKKN